MITPLPKTELVIGGYWSESYQPMISAIGEVYDKVWVKYVGKSGKIWLLPKDEPQNSMVIVQGNLGSQGFGGREMEFKLDTGETLVLKGPWSSNHDAFWGDTGVDRRAHYRTWGCIGRNRTFATYTGKYASSVMTINDLVYIDPEDGIIGEYDRINKIAKRMAFERDELLFKYSCTYGGSSSGCIMPYENDPEYVEYLKTGWPTSRHRDTKWHEIERKYWAKYYDEFGDFRHKQGEPELQDVIACIEEAEGFDVSMPIKTEEANIGDDY